LLAGPREERRIAGHGPALLADELPGADVGVVELGPFPHHVHAEERAPRVAEQDDLFLAQPPAEVVRDRIAVVGELGDGHRALRLRRHVVGLPFAALVPHRQGVIAFPAAEGVGLSQHREAGAAIEQEQHRIGPVAPTDLHPLGDTVDLDVAGLVDSDRRIDAHFPLVGPRAKPDEGARHKDQRAERDCRPPGVSSSSPMRHRNIPLV